MRTFVKSITAVAALAAAAGAQAAIVDIDARDGAGTTIALAAGTYTLRLIGTADGGAYDGWNPWGSTQGCDGSGGNCDNGFIEQFGYDFGVDGVFDHATNGHYFTLEGAPGQTYRYAAGALALAVYTQMIQGAPFGATANSWETLPLSFTLAEAQQVNFFVSDNPYHDNLGGVSLDVSAAAVPEPAGWLMMLAGFGLAGSATRRRTRVRFAPLTLS